MPASNIFARSAKNQYYATFCTNLLTVSLGVSIGWASPNIPQLLSAETPLPSGPLTGSEVSNVISLLCLGGFFGNFAHAYIADR
jgi:SP family facilitated glucose transporter-like MFS transporter 8